MSEIESDNPKNTGVENPINTTNEKAKEKARASREKDNEIRRQNEEIIDKQILALSSAFLAISMAFSDKIVPLRDSIFIVLLIASWSFWFTSIFFILWTHYLVIGNARKRVNLNYQIWVEGKKELKDKYFVKSKGPRNFQLCAGILFLVGCICLLLYLGINTYKINIDSLPLSNKSTMVLEKDTITILRKDSCMSRDEWDDRRNQQEVEREVRSDSISDYPRFDKSSGSKKANEAIDLDDPEDHDEN